MADQLQISPDGHWLWDGSEWISVTDVPLRALEHLPGAQLSHDDDFWWNHVADRWERVAEASPSAMPPASPPSAPNPVTTTTPEREEPPTAEQMQQGRAMLDGELQGIVGPVSDLAEKVLKLGGNSEAVIAVLDRGGEVVHTLEMFEIGGEVVFAGAAAASIAGPFAMWFEAIQANYAGQLHEIRWQIYTPWMHGFISGLYGTDTGSVDELFRHWHQQAQNDASGLDDAGKRSVTGALMATLAIDQGSTVTERLSHDQWDARLDWRHAYQALEIALSHHDR